MAIILICDRCGAETRYKHIGRNQNDTLGQEGCPPGKRYCDACEHDRARLSMALRQYEEQVISAWEERREQPAAPDLQTTRTPEGCVMSKSKLESKLGLEGAKSAREAYDKYEARKQALEHVYQIVGVLLDEAGRMDTKEGALILDTISWLRGTRIEPEGWRDLLPFPPDAEGS